MPLRNVLFRSDGHELAGDLVLPDGPGPHPAVVLTGPFSGVKEQVTGTYARAFAERGVAALAFDHRSWGASEGTPRQHEDTAAKVADLRDAVGFLTTQPDVDGDRIAECGICLGGIPATRHAAFDPRVRALALVAAAYNEPAVMRERFGADNWAGLMGEFAAVAQRQFETGEVEYWPAANPEGMPAGMPGPEPWSYYGTERGARPGWENRCTVLSVQEELVGTAMGCYPAMATPVLFVHGTGDTSVPGDDARRAHAAANEPKQLTWVETANHVDLYDDAALVAEAVDAAVAWFATHAPAGGTAAP